MESRPEISIVAPCHNERSNLQPLADAMRAVLEPLGLAYEIVLVDDGSTDGSWDELKKLGAADMRSRGQRFAQQCGQSTALWAGIKAARGRVVVTMDADLQDPPSEIPRFLEALKNVDCVCGNRMAVRAAGDSWMRRATSHVANWVRNKVSGETITDSGCCYRAFRRECIENVRFFKGAHRFLPTLIKMEGFTVTEIPIGHNPRRSGRTHYGVWNRLFQSSTDLLAVRWMKKRMIHYQIAETLN